LKMAEDEERPEEETKKETVEKPAEEKKDETAVKQTEEKKDETAVKQTEEKKEEVADKPTEEKKDRKGVNIGPKPFMNYVNAVMREINIEGKTEIRARGKFTSRAIDVALNVNDQCMKGMVEVKGVEISTEIMKSDRDSKPTRVSSIIITLKKV